MYYFLCYETLLDYGFLFNAGTEREEAHGLNWDMTAFRPLDNALTRFHGIDLLSEDYVSFSPMHFGLNNPISLNDPLGLNANDFDDGSGRKEVDAGATGKKNQRGGEVFDTVDELVGYLYSLAGDGETHFTFKGEGANLRIIRISFLSGGSTNKNQETGIWQVPGLSFSTFDVQVRGTAQKAVQSNEAFAFYNRLNDSNQQWYNGVVSPLMDAVTAVSPLKYAGLGVKLAAGGWIIKGLGSAGKKVAGTGLIRKFARDLKIFSGQKSLRNSSIVDNYFAQMKNGTFNYSNGAAGFLHNGKTILTDGNHRMNAAIRYAIQTGDNSFINTLIKNGNFTKANPADYGIKIYNLPIK